MADSRRGRTYTLAEKAQALAMIEAEDGNLSKVSRQTGISRRTLRSWDADRGDILEDFEAAKQIQKHSPEEITIKAAEKKLENVKVGGDYKMVKRMMADNFSKITTRAQEIAWSKMHKLEPKDAMWIASVGIDKLMKLRGEPDQIVEVRNVVVHMVVEKLFEAVEIGVIDEKQAEKLGKLFDEIEEAEYEDV